MSKEKLHMGMLSEMRRVAGPDWDKYRDEIRRHGAIVNYVNGKIVGFSFGEILVGQKGNGHRGFAGQEGKPQAGLRQYLESLGRDDVTPEELSKQDIVARRKGHGSGRHYGRGKHPSTVKDFLRDTGQRWNFPEPAPETSEKPASDDSLQTSK
ncbi:hypothetical protein M1403_00060 [Patescibacteria group bacterium]|nr:hypothetical protein [Patescibacteria group bacterium]